MATTATSINPSPNILKWASPDGEFRRQASVFRDCVCTDARAKFPAESGRYHLYVSLACPWAHRTLMVRAIKGLEDCISVSVVHYLLGENGWEFPLTPNECDGATVEPNYGYQYLKQLYFKANPDYAGRFTVPVLWDKKTETIVNNESSEIIRMFNTTFDPWAKHPNITLYPEELRVPIDAINEWIYRDINNGVYRAGFATTQDAYDHAVKDVFHGLDRVEALLAEQRKKHGENGFWLLGAKLTEADVRLFTTIIRFDPVYHGHFKTNLKTIEHGYPNILRWAARVYRLRGVKETIDMTHIKRHYYMSHVNINPTRVVPIGNGPDLEAFDAS